MICDRNAVVLDVDCVVLDCDGGFATVGSVVLDRPVKKVCNSYDMKTRYNLSKSETDAIWKAMEHHEAGWKGLAEMPGARNAFFRLQAMEHVIHLVTNISEALRMFREECLAMHGMRADHIHCAGHMHASKASIIQEINPVFMIDDRLSHLHEVPFVPYRVWVDNDDDQGGLVVDEEIIHVKSLEQWVKAWEMCQNKPFRKSFRNIRGGLAA